MLLKRIRLKLSDIKGYSKSLDDETYGTAIFNRNCLTLYFHIDLAPLDFTQYVTGQIHETEEYFNEIGIQYLGTEKIVRNGFGVRTSYAFR